MKGIGPTLNGRNGEGDPYYTDGEIWMARLVDGGKQTRKPADMLPAPVLIQLKDTIFFLGRSNGKALSFLTSASRNFVYQSGEQDC